MALSQLPAHVVHKLGQRINIPLSSRSHELRGESGGIGRLNDDEVISQCDPITERERMLSTNWSNEE